MYLGSNDLFESMLKACILKMFLNFLMVMPEPWKGSVSEVYQIRTTDGSDERKVFPNSEANMGCTFNS